MSKSLSLLPENPRFITLEGTALKPSLIDRLTTSPLVSSAIVTTLSTAAYAASSGDPASTIVHAGLTGSFCFATLASPFLRKVIQDELQQGFGDDWNLKAIDKKSRQAFQKADIIAGASHLNITFKLSALFYSCAGVSAYSLEHTMGAFGAGSPYATLSAAGSAAMAGALSLFAIGTRFSNVEKGNWAIIDADKAHDLLERDRIHDEKTRLNAGFRPQSVTAPITVKP